MKKILSTLLIIGLLTPFLFTRVNANKDNYFVVTAYYSPLPGQAFYLKGNYKAEKRLNGEGIAGASGKGVFSGMLAAPKNYKFGTKIYLEGLGIGEVSDRGGAIVNAGKRGYKSDRIDVWVGYGDEGLRRALYWGKRKVKGNIISQNTNTTINYNNIASPSWAVNGLQKISPKIKKIDIFSKNLKTKEQIKELQKVLIEMKLYSGEVNGIYKDIIDSIYDFQVSQSILNSPYTYGAGTYGPKTRASLKKAYNKFLKEKEEKRLELVKLEEERLQEEQRKKELVEQYKKLEELSHKKAEDKISFIGKPKFGEISHSVRELQKVLKQLGYFDNKDTAIYGEITRQSIISYQINRKLINSKTDLGAGIIGPKTLVLLKNDLKNKFLEEIIIENDFDKGQLVNLFGNEA